MWRGYGGQVLLLAANPLHPGAVYHVTPPGDRREPIHGDDEDGGPHKRRFEPSAYSMPMCILPMASCRSRGKSLH